jgi:hypothetical protein
MYKKGSLIPQADGMSRLPSEQLVEISECNFIHMSTPLIACSEVAEHTLTDNVLMEICKYVSSVWPNKVNDVDIKRYFKLRKYLSVKENCLFYGERVVIPISLKSKILHILHHGHNGIVRTKLFARSYVWWFGMNEDIEKMINLCETCQSTQNASSDKELRMAWPKADSPWERVHMDLFDFKNEKYLIVCDAYSKWIECFQLTKSDFNHVISKLCEIFSRFAYPKLLVSDNGPPFNSSELFNFCKKRKIKLLHSPPYNPQSNGLAERSVQTFKKMLIKSLVSHDEMRLLRDKGY